MSTRIYIETKADESWRAISRPFCEWLQNQTHLERFGITEATPPFHEIGETHFLGFFLNTQNEKYLPYMKQWAEAQGRVWAEVSGGRLRLATGAIAPAPEIPNIEPPRGLNET